jgi:glycosyltransferase involved in cell wall biosynthesis
VVDGGSTHTETLETMRQLAADPPPCTRVLLRDDGRHLVGDNRNFGIEQARGRYVTCLDADDLLDPRYIEVALYLLERRGYDLVSTSTQCFGGSDESFELSLTPALSDMSGKNHVTTVAVYRRALWESAGGYHDSGLGAPYAVEDWQLWLRIAALGARMTNIKAPLFRYRVHSAASLSRHMDGLPDRTRHRAAVLAYNDDVRTPAALAESARRRGLEMTVQGAFENLEIVEEPHRPTVLFVLPFLLVGGAERLLSAVATYLSNAGFRVVVVSTLYAAPEFGDSTAWFEEATSEIYHLPRLLRRGYAADFLDYVVDTKQVDILFVAGSELAYHQLPGLRARHPRLRVVDMLFNTRGHIKNNRRYAAFIDLHFCENTEVRDWLLANGQDEESVVLVESGVDTSLRNSIDRPPTHPLRVGFSGRLAEEKAPFAFVDLARHMADPRFEFVITGAGPLESEVRRKVARLSGATVSFLGVVEDISAHLASLDVLVVPSIMDGRPVVVLEALALGVPVIASRVGGLPALIRDGETGFLVEPGDTDAIARHLRRLAESPGELEQLRKTARAFAERNLDAKAMNTAYERALRSLLSPSANTG